MPITVTRLPNEPIVHVLFDEYADLRVEIPTMIRGIFVARDSIEEPCNLYYLIMDLTHYKLTFGDLISLMGELKGVRTIRRADRPARILVVGIGGIIEMGVKALAQGQYGSYQSRLFSTFDEALNAARHQLHLENSSLLSPSQLQEERHDHTRTTTPQ